MEPGMDLRSVISQGKHLNKLIKFEQFQNMYAELAIMIISIKFFL